MTSAPALSTQPAAPNATSTRGTPTGAPGRFASTYAAALGMPAIAEMSIAVPAPSPSANAQSPLDRANPDTNASSPQPARGDNAPGSGASDPDSSTTNRSSSASDASEHPNAAADQADQPADPAQSSSNKPQPATPAPDQPLLTPTHEEAAASPLLAPSAGSAEALATPDASASTRHTPRPAAYQPEVVAAADKPGNPASNAEPAPAVPTDPLGLIRHDAALSTPSNADAQAEPRADDLRQGLFDATTQSTTPDAEPSRATLNARAASAAPAQSMTVPTAAAALGVAAAAPSNTSTQGITAKGTQDLLGMLGTAARPSVFNVSSKPGRAAAATPGNSSAASVEAQIARGLAAAMRQKGGLLTLRLNPEHLGPVRIEVRVDQDGVTVRLDAQNPQTRQKLLADLDALRRAIEDRGLKVHRVEVLGVADTPRPDSLRSADPTPADHNDHHGGRQWGGGDASDGQRHAGSWGQGSQQNPSNPWGHDQWDGESPDATLWSSSHHETDRPNDDPARGLLILRLDTVV